MTEDNKHNCLATRYKFDRYEKRNGVSTGRKSCREEWLMFLDREVLINNLTEYEKELCIEEFIPTSS